MEGVNYESVCEKLEKNLKGFTRSIKRSNGPKMSKKVEKIFKEDLYISSFTLSDDLDIPLNIFQKTIGSTEDYVKRIIEFLPIKSMIIEIEMDVKIEVLPKSLESLHIKSEKGNLVEIDFDLPLKELRLTNVVLNDDWETLKMIKELYLNKIETPEKIVKSNELEFLEMEETDLNFCVTRPLKHLKIINPPFKIDLNLLKDCDTLIQVELMAMGKNLVKGSLPEKVEVFKSRYCVITDLNETFGKCKNLKELLLAELKDRSNIEKFSLPGSLESCCLKNCFIKDYETFFNNPLPLIKVLEIEYSSPFPIIDDVYKSVLKKLVIPTLKKTTKINEETLSIRWEKIN